MYMNSQWRVTQRGLETVEGAARDYWIDASKLVETRLESDGLVYEHLADLGLKTWLIQEFFEEAYEAALAYHAARLPTPVDATILERSKRVFRENVERTRRTRAT